MFRYAPIFFAILLCTFAARAQTSTGQAIVYKDRAKTTTSTTSDSSSSGAAQKALTAAQQLLNQQNASPGLKGIGSDAATSQNNYGGLQDMTGDCAKFPKPATQMMNTYYQCTRPLAASVKERDAMIVDMDNKVGYIVDGQGNVKSCFTVTIGSNGEGTGVNQTEPGLFFSSLQDGDKYQTNNPDYEKKGISMGIGGKIVHSDHGNRTTAGCIGVEQDKFPQIFSLLSNWNTPIFAWGEKNQTCGSKYGGVPGNQGTGGTEQGTGTNN